jgi:hypothetical protein
MIKARMTARMSKSRSMARAMYGNIDFRDLAGAGAKAKVSDPDVAPKGSPAQSDCQHRLCLKRSTKFEEIGAMCGN